MLSGATAAIAGFGIGSLLTPLLAVRLDVSLAVALVSVPHALATALRCWRLRCHIDRRVLSTFGVLSAGGGLAGALLFARATSRAITLILAALLLATALVTLFDLTRRWTPGRGSASVLGLLSGFFGGVAGNQGGLRAAALLSIALTPAAFVATSTAVGLLVDAARLPIYLWTAGPEIARFVTVLGVSSLGVLAGTLLGERLLFGLAPRHFRRAVALLIAALALWLAWQAR